jgi:hypothetical protein
MTDITMTVKTLSGTSATGPILTVSFPDEPNPLDPPPPPSGKVSLGKLTVEMAVSTATIGLRQILVLGAAHMTATLKVVETGLDNTYNIVDLSVETTATHEQPSGETMTINCDFESIELVQQAAAD